MVKRLECTMEGCGKIFEYVVKRNNMTYRNENLQIRQLKYHIQAKHTSTSDIKCYFKCDFCQKSFHIKGNLKTHEKIHTQPKKFGCDICTKTFQQKGNLNAHHKRRHLVE